MPKHLAFIHPSPYMLMIGNISLTLLTELLVSQKQTVMNCQTECLDFRYNSQFASMEFIKGAPRNIASIIWLEWALILWATIIHPLQWMCSQSSGFPLPNDDSHPNAIKMLLGAPESLWLLLYTTFITFLSRGRDAFEYLLLLLVPDSE